MKFKNHLSKNHYKIKVIEKIQLEFFFKKINKKFN